MMKQFLTVLSLSSKCRDYVGAGDASGSDGVFMFSGFVCLFEFEHGSCQWRIWMGPSRHHKDKDIIILGSDLNIA